MDDVEAPRTARLRGEHLAPAHLDDLVRMHADPAVMVTLGGLRSHAETECLLNEWCEHWRRHGFGLWLWREAATGSFVGRGGLRHTEVEGRDEVELAYALMPPYWGRGLATELGQTSVRIGFERLGLRELVCFTWDTNHASRRVMEKIGFRYTRHFVRAELSHVLYRLTAL